MTTLAMGGILGVLLCGAVEWPQFRGPSGDGVATAQAVPVQWSETEHITWKTAIPGRGWSSPVVGNGLVWMTTAIERQLTDPAEIAKRQEKLAGNPMAKQMSLVGSIALHAVAVDLATGAIKYDIKLFDVDEPQPVHSLNSFASPSPILDEQNLYCHFGTYGTACVDLATAKVRWQTRLANEHSVGPGSSPVLHEDVLIIPCDGTEKQHVTGLDISTGKTVWRTKRPPLTGTEGDFHKAFSTPLMVRHQNRDQALVMGAQWFVAYDPQSGKELWRIRHGEGFSNVPRPVAGHGLAYICTGYMQPQLWAVKLDGAAGELKESQVAWQVKRQVPAMPSPVVSGSELFFISDQGIATSVDALTGEQLWQQRLAGNYSSSPLAVDGKIYVANRDGKTTVLRAGRTFEELAANTLDGQIMASPVALDGLLLLRTGTHLYRVGE